MSTITGKQIKSPSSAINIKASGRLKNSSNEILPPEIPKIPTNPLKTYHISDAEKAEQIAKTQRLKAAREREEALNAEKERNSSGKLKSMKSNGSITKRSNVNKSASNHRKNMKFQDKITKNNSWSKEPAAKKLNFKDIMAHASTVDTEKLKMNIKSKEKKVNFKDNKKEKSNEQMSEKNSEKQDGSTVENMKNKPIKSPKSSDSSYMVQPMEKILEKQRKRKLQKQSKNADLYEMDDFIVDDEEDRSCSGRGYDRDEIWSIFNRGKKRQAFYDDYSDDSDMEARGSEIFEEEARSSLAAKKEDEEQERKLMELAAEKRKKKAQLRKKG